MTRGVTQAVVLVGGEGTRLRPLTNNRPKPLLPVLGRPCVEYTLRALGAAGIQKVYLACGFKSMEVVKAIGDGKRFGIDVVFAFEEEPMGTAGAVKLLESKLPEAFVVVMGDVLVDIDFEQLIRFHQDSRADATIALTEVENPEQFGIVGLEKSGRISRFKEKPKPDEVFSKLINAGVYVLKKEVFKFVPEATKFDFSKNLFPKLMEEGKALFGSRLHGMWHDIGRPIDLLKANIGMAERRGAERQIVGVDIEGKVFGNSFQAEGAKLVGPVYLGDGARLGEKASVSRSGVGEGSVIEGGATVIDSLVLTNCRVRKGAYLNGCIVGDNGVIGEGARLKDCILGDNVSIRDLASLEGKTLES